MTAVTTIDRAAVAALRREQLDHSHKGLPPALYGTTIEAALASGLELFAAGFTSPILTIDRDAMTHNIAEFAAWCAAHDVELAPHGKTTMSPELFELQLSVDTWGLTAATAGQARVYRAFGVDSVMIANEVTDPADLAWIAAEKARDPRCRLMIWVDSIAGVELAAASADPAHPLEVLLEWGALAGRGGCRDVETALAVAAAVRAEPSLRLAGVAGYEGAVAHGADAPALTQVDAYLGSLRQAVEALDAHGCFADRDEIVVSAGGSAYFDRVVAELGGTWARERRIRLVLRSGCYLTHDDGYYGAVTPAARGAAGAPTLRAAMTILSRVTSRPEPGLALLAMGKRDVAYDEGLPVPVAVHSAAGGAKPLTGLQITALNDQHAFLTGPDEALPGIGDWVACGISHPCATFDRWRLIPVVQGERVVGLAHTYF